MKPNILLICVDQMRADCISALNSVVQTPNLDNFIRSGVTFNNAYTAVPACVPARVALHTGMSQRSHGRTANSGNKPRVYEHMLAEEFSKANYHTQCVGKMHVNPVRKLCGFHNIQLHDGYVLKDRRKEEVETDDYLPWLRQRAGADADIIDHGLDCNSSTTGRPWHLDESLHPTNWVVTQSIDFLRRRDPEKPFFLFMSFVAPHPPLMPPEYYYNMYMNMDLPKPAVGDWADKEDINRAGLNPVAFNGIPHPVMHKQALAAYYAMITHIDHQMGRFMIAMRDFGVVKDTIVLFVSDHGDMMGDHNLHRKGLPYEGSAKIPLILNDPTGLLDLKDGSAVDEPVEIMDIMPTLLDAAEIEIPKTVDGQSVLPLARGEHVPWRDYIHGEFAQGILPNQYLTNGKEKYIWFTETGEEQLFDLTQDPEEMINLAGEPQQSERLASWRRNLMKELDGRPENFTDGEKLITGKRR